jgi:hypothetical protein
MEGNDRLINSKISEGYAKLTEEDLLELKQKYDTDYDNYWTSKNKPPKFGHISLEEFKKRLKNSSVDFFLKYGKL